MVHIVLRQYTPLFSKLTFHRAIPANVNLCLKRIRNQILEMVWKLGYQRGVWSIPLLEVTETIYQKVSDRVDSLSKNIRP